MTDGLYKLIRDSIEDVWDDGWTHSGTEVPVYWRSNDADPLPDPSSVSHFLRNEVSFGREAAVAYGGGRFRTERLQFGSIVIRVFASRAVRDEDTLLNLLSDAMEVFRSKREGSISFIGPGSGFDEGATEDGNWFYRASLQVFEYRFQG